MKSKYMLILWFVIGYLWAVGEAGAIFLLIAPGAGPAGTGEAQVAKANDAYASYYNPAGLGFLQGKEVAGMHVNWLPNLASDLFYEFLAYRHYIDGLGSVGGHVIFLNLGEQIGMDELGNPTTNWTSFMAAGAGSFGTHLSETSSIGFNFKVFHQKLSDFTTGSEAGQGYSTDFGFDIGYLKKFKQNSTSFRLKKKKKLNRLFDQLADIYNRQDELNDQILSIFEKEGNVDKELDVEDYKEETASKIPDGKDDSRIIQPPDEELDDASEKSAYDIDKVLEEQIYLREDLDELRAKLQRYDTMTSYLQLNERIDSTITDMDRLIDLFSELQDQVIIPDSLETFGNYTPVVIDRILFELLEIKSIRGKFTEEVETMEVQNMDDIFNFGISISNIGPKIDFVDVDQADPSPMNMKLGIFAQLYNDGYNKVNFLFDVNKLLVTRYQMMDWDGDGIVGGYDQFENFVDVNDPLAVYNKDGKKEYDNKLYFDDPWYFAIFTSWLDDWYFGGDIDHSGDRKIGGYICSGGEVVEQSLEEFECEGGVWDKTDNNLDFADPEYGIYGEPFGQDNDRAKIEKGNAENRSFMKEFDETIYNMGLEYWYTDAFALRAGYIHDFEGKIFNPTFGAGIRLLQYGFDFGYTAGKEGHPRANTMFFSVNIKI